MRLVATKKFKYATRRLVAGDEFEAPDAHGLLLVGWRKAQRLEDEIVSELDKLRTKAAALGIRVDKRWGVARLMNEIGDA